MNINIRSYISKDLVFGAFGGAILGTIIAGLIDGKAIEESNKELKLSNDKLEEVLANFEEYRDLINKQKELIKEQKEFQKKANEKIKELEEKLRKYIVKEVKEKEEQAEREKVKEVIDSGRRNKWDEVYRLTEHWYNHTPCQMSRAEVFTNLEKDGYITKEDRNDAYDYFGNLWFYVGDWYL